MFWIENRKIGIPLHTPVLLYKLGFKEVYITWTCFRSSGSVVAERHSFFVLFCSSSQNVFHTYLFIFDVYILQSAFFSIYYINFVNDQLPYHAIFAHLLTLLHSMLSFSLVTKLNIIIITQVKQRILEKLINSCY